MTDLLDTSDLIATFDADFTVPLKLRAGKVDPAPPHPLRLHDRDFTWVSGYIHALPLIGVRGSASHLYPAWSSLGSRTDGIVHGEAEVYPNADAIQVTGTSPFRQEHRQLHVVASRMPDRIRNSVPPGLPCDYLSGALVTYPFGQRYGVFELRARLPRGRGLWPAFWLLPCDMSWPPEIDIMEVLGHDPATLYTSVHTRQSGQDQHIGKTHRGVDLSLDFNIFAADWGPRRIVFYLNHRAIFACPTPADLHKPCYLLLNFAVGAPGSWPGAPDAATPFPASMTVTHVRAWQRRRYVGAF